jgi:UDP-glucose 4-epimerase
MATPPLRCMVVGGAGFIGSHLVDRLLAEGHTVDVVDDLSTGSLANLGDARALGAELKIHHLDACASEFGSLVAMRTPEVIFHLGWLPPGHHDPATLARSVQSTLNVLESARLHGTTKVVTALPAGALYGEVPARELPVKEGRPWAPTGAVGVIAQAVAELFAVYRQQHDVEYSALALTNVYGPRQRVDGGVVARFLAARSSGEAPVFVGDGRQARDFLFIDDAVDAFVRSARRGSGLVVNVGTGVLTSIRDLWTAIAGPDAPSPRFVPSTPEDLARVAVAPTRARIHLAWAPWTSLDAGLRSLDR